ncbi:TIGR02452 family protein [Candidatus Uabimicrobium amorphum]|uniref:TIGR02452 family protein n=1 Tax=Uabimicrobium amorphum TaxID=2596890 RepID=A0A5S9IKX5_UABAM|nr:TIGR02452 family protein [Candidatus Uabimicrobium amorphum]BBM83440.1 TIGR02452 family protein [Candidatus Uabimicrobium amorphum]
MHVNRKKAAEIATDTLKIIEQGYYTVGKEQVPIDKEMQRAIAGTYSYPPHSELPSIEPGEKNTQIQVTNETTLSATERLVVEEGLNTVALNFASAKNPGGGFRSGARAQEESLARSSALYPCLVNNEMYTFHRQRKDPFYTNYALYSPDVPVFKRDSGELLHQPYLCSFITSPAVNAGVIRKRKTKNAQQICDEMQQRIHKVLTIAALYKHDAIVLGAWGCGVFGNDSTTIAHLFYEELQLFSGVFSKVSFAITDHSKKGQNIQPFTHAFDRKS